MPADSQDTCWTVLHAAAGGDAHARAEFSSCYVSAIRGFLAARWNGRLLAVDVDDATQEVFLECLKPGGVLERADPEQGEFRALLFGVVRNIARRFEDRAVERGRVRPEDSAWLQRVAADEPGQATLFDRSWAETLMHRAKQLHLERARSDGEAGTRRIELLERRFGDGEAVRHIAAEWGVPAQDLHNAYRKARAEFYQCLRDVVGFHAPAGANVGDECRRLLDLLG